MGIRITKIRIENFRSLEYVEAKLGSVNVLIGANNSGKSNFLKAVNVALGQNHTVSAEDIFVKKDEILDKSKAATIDIMFRPFNDEETQVTEFSDFWIGAFTEEWITNDVVNGDFVGIRTLIRFDLFRNDYVIEHRRIVDWGNSISEAVVENRRKPFTRDMLNYLSVFYMDAQRDVVADLRDRKSYFGRATSRIDLLPEAIQDIESSLNEVNSRIVDSIPALRTTANRISSITSTIGNTNAKVEIEPLARKIADLHKGMDIFFMEDDGVRLSVSQHGMGTRSWISFLTLGAYVDLERNAFREDDPESELYAMLTMEEPEAHLHPQAQQQLYSQLRNFTGQKIISTHSPSIVSQADLGSLIHFKKSNGKTIAHPFDIQTYKTEDLNRIKREIISSRGELLFAKAIVMCEGITEQQALPIFFEEYFGANPLFSGINFIGIGGQNYGVFLPLIRDFDIPWFIFSDGEKKTIDTVKNALENAFGTEKNLDNSPNVVILNNGYNYEKSLLKSGYVSEIVDAIDAFEKEQHGDNYVQKFSEHMNRQPRRGRQKTSKPRCPQCGQEIYENILRNYDGSEGWETAVYDCMTRPQAKAKYAVCVAESITQVDDISRRIPPKVAELFNIMSERLNLKKRSVYESLSGTASDCKS